MAGATHSILPQTFFICTLPWINEILHSSSAALLLFKC